jgi:hypothetical protein
LFLFPVHHRLEATADFNRSLNKTMTRQRWLYIATLGILLAVEAPKVLLSSVPSSFFRLNQTVRDPLKMSQFPSHVCVKWRYIADFGIITFSSVWPTERKGSSKSTRGMRSPGLKTPSNLRTRGLSVSFVEKTDIQTYFPAVKSVSGLPEHAVNFMRDGELGRFRFVKARDDSVPVNHLALTYIFE